MSTLPTWLEPLARLEDFGGNPDAYIAHLFSIFERDFIKSQPQFEGKRVFHDKANDGGKPRAFSHITTEEDRKTKQRILSIRRCERISWIKAIIEHADDPAVLIWKQEQATKKRWAARTYFFLEQEDFLVILQEIKYGNYLITAIYVDNPSQKQKHLKAHAKSQENQKP
ncbi:MAG: hypothetical protein Q7S08_04555 [bacterium]|nr:hypothetical protein [bacterium]